MLTCHFAHVCLQLYDNEKVKDYERLARRILALKNKPALVMMQVCMYGQYVGPSGVNM